MCGWSPSATEIDASLTLAGLSGRLHDVPVSRLSAGQRRRTSLACLLVVSLTYAEREVAVTDEESREEIEVGLEALANKYGWQRVKDVVARMSRKD